MLKIFPIPLSLASSQDYREIYTIQGVFLLKPENASLDLLSTFSPLSLTLFRTTSPE